MNKQFKYATIFIFVQSLLYLCPAGTKAWTEASQKQTDQSNRSDPMGKLRGKVKEQDGKPLDSVIVRATKIKNKEEKWEAKSDGKGEFEFDALPPGEYSLSFERTGFKTFTTRKLEIIPGETLKLSRTIELVREGDPYSVIRGAVFFDLGYTMPNAAVTIERIDGVKKFKQATVSREGGEFAFRLRAEKARYRITAIAPGFQPSSVEIDIENDELRNIALTLKKN